MISVNVDEDMLTTETAPGLRHGTYKDATIIDCECTAFRVKDVSFVSGKGKYWGYTPTLNRIIYVALTLDEKMESVPFEKAKQKVLRWMRIERGSIVGEEEWNDFMNSVRMTRTMPELLNIILPHYDTRKLFDSLRKW